VLLRPTSCSHCLVIIDGGKYKICLGWARVRKCPCQVEWNTSVASNVAGNSTWLLYHEVSCLMSDTYSFYISRLRSCGTLRRVGWWISTIFHQPSNLKTETAGSPEMIVPIYKPTRRHISEDGTVDTERLQCYLEISKRVVTYCLYVVLLHGSKQLQCTCICVSSVAWWWPTLKSTLVAR